MSCILDDERCIPELLTQLRSLSLDFLAGAQTAAAVDTRLDVLTQQAEMPEEGLGCLDALRTYWQRYADGHSRSTGPRYYGFVTGGVTPAALAGDWLVSVLDQNVATERHSIAAFIEAQVLTFISNLLKLPADLFQGVLTTGATAANLVGLSSAREWCGEQAGVSIAHEGIAAAPPIAVFGASAHSSIIKSLGVLGIGRKNIVAIRSLPDREAMDIQHLEEALKSSASTSRIVVASAGTVNSGDFDDLNGIADLCMRYNAWLHVDAAFGAFARCSPRYEHLIEGLERADSITADAHKWLNVPYDCGIALTRHTEFHERSFSADAPYVPMGGELPAFMNRGVEQSRRYRALPLWMTLMAYGKSGYRELVERNCDVVRQIASWMDGCKYYDVLCPVYLNIVMFRCRRVGGRDHDAHSAAVLERINATGALFLTPSTYNGEKVFRLAVCNWMTTRSDVAIVINALHHAVAGY
ncbi:pyridoxal-dependent decarboxylase [Pseudomonas syringae pv. tagetis]|uniref:Pyridoxal-dependent decarboxylase n=2 Tax=Pseudomonas syringae pv. tagetis TaxID=129140 RepID=A0A0Q0EC06_9PSED|nr:Pyridoxal-dependent decarboxylase [Pseudomonas syringae pv. tagetis]RMW09942.1 Pyridoxal-dependent decarboxylase [Pseudomonas syringae pv. tagetis]RMW22616.1 Pyridoxal-dependent decarboxylase [Pseudomonas syringae pv. tagetis]